MVVGKSGVLALFVLGAVIALMLFVAPVEAGSDGVGEFRNSENAFVFSGRADGADGKMDGTVFGDPMYANDHLVMKWSKAWDAAAFHGDSWTAGAWCSNEWDGNVPGGSGECESCKIIWVGPELQDSPLWHEGGTAIWGEFELIVEEYTFVGAARD
jgi:hypothetical protein